MKTCVYARCEQPAAFALDYPYEIRKKFSLTGLKPSENPVHDYIYACITHVGVLLATHTDALWDTCTVHRLPGEWELWGSAYDDV